MLFHEIQIANLFSYRGKITFDLGGHQSDRPIVIINGRNGFGKTSFLNSVKLLFIGPAEELRNEIQAGRKLSPKSYMLGNGTEWKGVFNWRAHTKQGKPQYFVQCLWQEEAGMVTARREWSPDADDFSPVGHLTIHANFLDDPLEGEKAQNFLDKRLPSSYLPYFFFDGEKIQTLAESNREQVQKQMESILNIAPIETLIEYLDKVKKSWAKEGSMGEEQRKFNELQRNLEKLGDDLDGLAERRKARQEELEELDESREELDRRMHALRGFQAQEDEVRLQEESQRVQEDLARSRQEVVDLFAPEAPLVVNSPLMEKLLNRLEQKDQEVQSIKDFLDYLRKHLPVEVFDRPVPHSLRLRDDQKEFYRNERLCKVLEKINLHEKAGEDNNTLAMTPERQYALRRLLIQLLDSNPLHMHGARLQDVSRLARRKVELEQELNGIGTAIQTDREHFLKMQEEKKNVERQRDNVNQALGGIIKEIHEKEKALEQTRSNIKDQEEKISQAGKGQSRMTTAASLMALFQEYKQRLRDNRREALEQAINRHFKTLMTSHDMVHRIQVNEDFGCNFLDREETVLGMANLSAGMKQLAAIALLWALKEVSGRSVPVIVDTPLARIDRKNQENLLRDYFPHAAEQVIVLPTDSELDLEKYQLLARYVYKEFTLINPHGDQTSVEQRPMYPV